MISKNIGLNRLTVKSTTIVVIIVALLLTIVAYINARKHHIIKNQEKKINIFKKIELYIVRMLHYSASVSLLLYPFFTEVSMLNDIIFTVFNVFFIIHRFIFSECILSIKEKQILDPNYVAGSNTTYEPYYDLIYDSKLFCTTVIRIGQICILIVFIRCLYNLFIIKQHRK